MAVGDTAAGHDRARPPRPVDLVDLDSRTAWTTEGSLLREG
jgi:hypothetical protein